MCDPRLLLFILAVTKHIISAPIRPHPPPAPHDTLNEPKPAKIPRIYEPRCKPTLSEVFYDFGAVTAHNEFIELRLNCAVKSGATPKNLLAGYKVILIRATPLSIITIIDFDNILLDITVRKQFLLLGSGGVSQVDVSLSNPKVQNVLSNIMGSQLLPDWGTHPFAIILVQDGSRSFRSDFSLTYDALGRLQPRIIGNYHAQKLKGKVMDMLLLGRFNNEQFRFFHSLVSNVDPQSLSVPESKNPKDLINVGLSFCGSSYSGFSAHDYVKAIPTPGLPNACVEGQNSEHEQASTNSRGVSQAEVPLVKNNLIKVGPNQAIHFNKVTEANDLEQCSKYLPQREGILFKPEFNSWLQLDSTPGMCRFSCFICKAYFSLGFRPDVRHRSELTKELGYSPSSDIYQTSRVIKLHMDTDIHKQAQEFASRVLRCQSQEDYDMLVWEFEERERQLYNSTMNVILTVYFEAYHSLSFNKHEPLMEVLALIGASIGYHHHSNVAANQIVKVISQSFQGTLLRSLISSNFFFTLLCDSSTNNNEAYLICYIQTVINGLPVSHLYAILHLSNGEKGIEMANTVKSKVQEDNQICPGWEDYFKNFIIGIVSDGANSMVGDSNSFKTHLMAYVNRKVPNVICLAHRLDTAIKSALKVPSDKVKAAANEAEKRRIQYFEHFEDYSNMCFTFYASWGHKRWLHLQKIAEELNLMPLRLKRFIKVRWSASHHNAMVALDRDYVAMIIDLQRISIGDGNFDKTAVKKAETLHTKLIDKAYAITVREFLDFLGIFKELSLEFQGSSSILVGKIELLYSVIGSLQVLGKSIGKNVEGFLAKCSCTGICSVGRCSLVQYEQCTQVMYENVVLRDTDPSSILLSEERPNLYTSFEASIRSYFKLDVMSAFEIFDPKWISFYEENVGQQGKTGEEFPLYIHNSRAVSMGVNSNVNQKITTICLFYFLPAAECSQFSKQWLSLIQNIAVNKLLKTLRAKETAEFWNAAMQQDVGWSPLTQKVLKYVLVTAYSSAICERGFSYVNAIKTKERSRMGKDTLDALVRIKANGPPVTYFNSYKYTKEFFRAGYARVDDNDFNGGRPKKEPDTCKSQSYTVMCLLVSLCLLLTPGAYTQLQLPVQSIPRAISTLYDARTAQFSSYQLLPNSKVKQLVTFEQLSRTTFEHSIIRSEEDVFKTKNIDIEAELNIRLGLLSIGASGSFANTVTASSSSRRVIGFSNYYQEITLMAIDFCDPEVFPFIRHSFMNSKQHTHAVQGVVLGVEFEALAESEILNEEDTFTLESEVTAGLEQAFGNVKAGAKLQYSTTDNKTSRYSRFKIKTKSNIDSQGNHPKTFEDIQSFLVNIPYYLNQTSGRKGSPIRLILQDMREIRECLNIDSEATEVYEIENTVMRNISRTLNAVDLQRKVLGDLKSDLDMFEECFTLTVHNSLETLSFGFEEKVLEFVQQMRQQVIAVRSGSFPPSVLQESIGDYMSNKYSPKNLQTFFVKRWAKAATKIKVYRLGKMYNVSCVKADSMLHDVVLSNLPKLSLFFMIDVKHIGNSLLFQNLTSFLKICADDYIKAEHRCQIWDCDFALNSCEESKPFSVHESPFHHVDPTGKVSNALDIHLQNKRTLVQALAKYGDEILNDFKTNPRRKAALIKELDNKQQSLVASRAFIQDSEKFSQSRKEFDEYVYKSFEKNRRDDF